MAFVGTYIGEILRFSEEQFLIWLRIVRNPMDVIAATDLRSVESAIPALRFAFFVYGFCVVLALPKEILIDHINLDSTQVLWTVLPVDMVLMALEFAACGFLLHVTGRLLWGHGGLGESLGAGLYLTALLPFVQLVELLALPICRFRTKQELCRAPCDPAYDVWREAVFLVALALLARLWIVKVMPVLRHVHRIGGVRAAIAAVVTVTLYGSMVNLYVNPLLSELRTQLAPPTKRCAAAASESAIRTVSQERSGSGSRCWRSLNCLSPPRAREHRLRVARAAFPVGHG